MPVRSASHIPAFFLLWSFIAGNISRPERHVDLFQFPFSVNIVLVHIRQAGRTAIAGTVAVAKRIRYDLLPFFFRCVFYQQRFNHHANTPLTAWHSRQRFRLFPFYHSRRVKKQFIYYIQSKHPPGEFSIFDTDFPLFSGGWISYPGIIMIPDLEILFLKQFPTLCSLS